MKQRKEENRKPRDPQRMPQGNPKYIPDTLDMNTYTSSTVVTSDLKNWTKEPKKKSVFGMVD